MGQWSDGAWRWARYRSATAKQGAHGTERRQCCASCKRLEALSLSTVPSNTYTHRPPPAPSRSPRPPPWRPNEELTAPPRRSGRSSSPAPSRQRSARRSAGARRIHSYGPVRRRPPLTALPTVLEQLTSMGRSWLQAGLPHCPAVVVGVHKAPSELVCTRARVRGRF